MDSISLITLIIITILVVGVLYYYRKIMQQISIERSELYKAFSQTFIGGVAGGVTLAIATNLAVYLNGNMSLEATFTAVLILISLLAFFITFSLLLYVKAEEKYGRGIPRRRGFRKKKGWFK